jgi:hypothetical protein
MGESENLSSITSDVRKRLGITMEMFKTQADSLAHMYVLTYFNLASKYATDTVKHIQHHMGGWAPG